MPTTRDALALMLSKPAHLTCANIAAKLGVSESAIENVVAPLVDRGVLVIGGKGTTAATWHSPHGSTLEALVAHVTALSPPLAFDFDLPI